MFGLQTMDHDTRYAYAEEWVEIVQKLWTVEEEFDYAGNFFTIEKGFHQPKPLQRPHPPIMNAGSSGVGARFAAKNADMAFLGFYEDGLDSGKAALTEMRRIAEQGRRDPNMPPELYERIKRRVIAGWGGYPLIGTAEQIVDQLTALTNT